MPTTHRLYGELAAWWPLLSDPADYAEEAAWFAALPELRALAPPRALLELGSGGGNLASHLAPHFELVLCDLSPQMLAMSRALNPGVEHAQGDMRTVRLGRTFDAVLIHDAIMYCATAADARAAIATAAAHCRPGGAVVIAPDCLRESFQPGTETGGGDAPDGRGLRYLEWSFDPDPTDESFETIYTVVLREPDGSARVELDRHVLGLFSESQWLAWLRDAGFAARALVDPWRRHVFVGVRRVGDDDAGFAPSPSATAR
jgi:SAM-dependent methyltransferase